MSVVLVAWQSWPASRSRSGHHRSGRTHVVAYFDNSNGIFAGDDVVILGVTVGQIDKIEPQPQRAKITFLDR